MTDVRVTWRHVGHRSVHAEDWLQSCEDRLERDAERWWSGAHELLKESRIVGGVLVVSVGWSDSAKSAEKLAREVARLGGTVGCEFGCDCEIGGGLVTVGYSGC